MAVLSKLGKYDNTALLLLRVGIGAMMIMHGYPKLLAGPEKWTKLGNNMSYFGVKAYPEIFGFLASVSEAIGGVFLILGFFFRPSAFFLLCTMVVAATSHIYKTGDVMEGSNAIELGIVFLAMFIIGPGKFSIDKS
jgi:putative oxidoreductase